MRRTIEASDLWQVHRALLGGVSSATGAPLPEKLHETPLGAQGAHYGMAVFIAFAFFGELPALPPSLSEEEGVRLRTIALEQLAGLAEEPK